MPDEPRAIFEIRGEVAWLTLNRPQRRNAIDGPMHGDLRNALAAIEYDAGIACLVLTGAGDAFCSGQDLGERGEMLDKGEVDLAASLDCNYNPLVRRLAALPFPVIAAVHGIASGAGAALAIGCDIVVAARSARFQFAFAKVALGPDCGTSWLLPRLVGQGRALALALTAEPIDADEAQRIGLVWKVVEDGALNAEAQLLAERLAGGPRTALAAIKQSIHLSATQTLDAALDTERDQQGALGRHPDYREAVSAFLAKRTPRFVH